MTIEIVAADPDRLRIDATAALGTYLGTVVSKDGRFAWLSAYERRFVTGPSGSAAARAALRLPVGPRDVIAILFDDDLGGTWTCSSAAQGRRSCRNADGASVEVEADGDARRIALGDPRMVAPAELRIEEVRTNGRPEEKTFGLDKPDGYSETALSN